MDNSKLMKIVELDLNCLQPHPQDPFLPYDSDKLRELADSTDSNLRHREKLLPSEKAFAYKLRLEAVKKRKKRGLSTKTGTSEQVAHLKKTEYIVAGENKTSREDVRRHIRLTHLIQELLNEADNGNLSLVAGVSLSYLMNLRSGRYIISFLLNRAAALPLRKPRL